jgi:hypothetical protein
MTNGSATRARSSIACLRSWHKSGLGSSQRFFETMATAERERLSMLCEGTAAQHYFAAGNERMLGGIMGTMAPRLEVPRQAAAAQGGGILDPAGGAR